MTWNRFPDEIHVLWNLRCYQLCSPLNLVEVLHDPLCIAQVVKHLVLHLMHSVHGYADSSFSSNDFVLRLLPVLENLFEDFRLSGHCTSQSRVCLLSRHPHADGKKQRDANDS